MMKPYISTRTRDAALRALEDLPTETLLGAMKTAPISEFRRKELAESYALDMAQHEKTFARAPEDPQKAPKEPDDPERLMAAMKYAAAPSGPSAGERGGVRVRSSQRAPDEGDPLGPMRVKRPELPDGELRLLDGMHISGGEDQASAEGGAE